MSEQSVLGSKVAGLYKKLCQDEWNANTVGILVGLFTILIMAWWRPWGAVGAVKNWGEWILYGVGVYEPINVLTTRFYLQSQFWLEVVSSLNSSADIYYSFDID